MAAAVPAARAAAPPPPPRRAATAAGRTSAAAAADVPLTTADPAPANRAAESDVVAREIGTMTLLGLCTRRSIAEILLFYEDKDTSGEFLKIKLENGVNCNKQINFDPRSDSRRAPA